MIFWTRPAKELRAQALNARTVLEQLRDKVENADPASKRELVLALVERIEVSTKTEENGKRVPHVTIRYRFTPPTDPNNWDCKRDVLATTKTVTRASLGICFKVFIGVSGS